MKYIITFLFLIFLFSCQDEKKVKNYCVSKEDDGLTKNKVFTNNSFPDPCLSSVAISIFSSYTAYITIYNERQEVIWNSIQKKTIQYDSFGNPQLSYISWNHRDNNGDLVDEGMYEWDVRFDYNGSSSRRTFTEYVYCPSEEINC